MSPDLEPPGELYGFGSVLLWVLATRATAVVDTCFHVGPARPSPEYGTVDGHPVPTASVVAWLLTAAEFHVPVEDLGRRDAAMDARQHVLRTIVSRVIGGRSELFENRWLDDLVAICHLDAAERDLLFTSRDETGQVVDPAALRQAIAVTLRSRSTLRDRHPAAARTLPRDITSFTGRTTELRELMATITVAPHDRVVGIHAIGGMAGVGKTAFAVHAAHQLAERFPDGQIFLPLHGHTPGQRPVAPADALARLLQISGVGAAQLPSDLDARAAMWRDHVSDKQLLLLLDDAVGHDHVRPLLPGASRSLVIITSRRRLTALEDVHSISLDTLPTVEAGRLFVRLAGRPGLEPGDADVGRIIELCGRLPMALGMLARRLHHHPAWTAADLAAELGAARDRLALMQAEDLSVAAAFDVSYQDLTDREQQLFRCLGLHPGDDIDAYAAAALTGADLAVTRRDLETLYDHHLLSESVAGRYRLHDLLRAHARTRAAEEDPADDRDRALARLLDHYEGAAAHAARLLSRFPSPRQPTSPRSDQVPEFRDRQRALSWARTERGNLLACVDHASSSGQHARVVALIGVSAPLLRQDGPWGEALSRHAAARHAARQIGDRWSEAESHWETGILHRFGGDYERAVHALTTALRIHRELGNQVGQANAWLEIGVVRRLTSDYPGAAEAKQEALDLYRAAGDAFGEANARRERGALAYQLGDYDTVVREQRTAIAIYRDLGDDLGEADALLYLGAVSRLTGDLTTAAAQFDAALAIFRDQGDQRGRANALTQLSLVRQAAGDHPGAVDALELALRLCRTLGYRAGEANALHLLAVTWRMSGRDDRAGELLAAALALYREIGDRGGAAEALNEVGTLHQLGGRLDQAEAAHEEAMAMALAIDSGWDEGNALVGLGRCAAADGRIADARDYFTRAQQAFRAVDPDKLAETTAELDALPAAALPAHP